MLQRCDLELVRLVLQHLHEVEATLRADLRGHQKEAKVSGGSNA